MTEIIDCEKEGFNSVFKSDFWQVASARYAKSYSKEDFTYMKRHLKTDEVFTLIEGEAVLHTVEDGKAVDIKIEKGKIYCVYKGTWHYLEISRDALLIIVENKDVFPEDTERMELECLLRK